MYIDLHTQISLSTQELEAGLRAEQERARTLQREVDVLRGELRVKTSLASAAVKYDVAAGHNAEGTVPLTRCVHGLWWTDPHPYPAYVCVCARA